MKFEEYLRTLKWFASEGAMFVESEGTGEARIPAMWYLPDGSTWTLETVERCGSFAEVKAMVLGKVAA